MDGQKPAQVLVAEEQTESSVALVENTVGVRLRNLRLDKGMSQNELGAGLFSAGYVSAVESGRIKPSLRALEALASRLGVPTTSLLEGNATPSDPSNTESLLRYEARLSQLEVALTAGHLAEANNLLAELNRSIGSPIAAVRLRYLQGWASLLNGETKEAERNLAATLELSLGFGQVELAARCHCLLGAIHHSRADHNSELNAYQQAYQLIKRSPAIEPAFKLKVITATAEAYAAQGKTEQALALYEEALQVEGRDPAAAAASCQTTSQHFFAAGDYYQARQMAERSLALYNYAAQMLNYGQLIGHYGMVLLEKQELNQAEQQLSDAVHLLADLGNHSGEALAYSNLAQLAIARNDVIWARGVATQAMRLLDEQTEPWIRGQVLSAMALVYEREGNHRQADELFAEGLALLEAYNATASFSKVSFMYGQELLYRGDPVKAAEYFQWAYLLNTKRTP